MLTTKSNGNPINGRHFTMLQSKQRHVEICGRRRRVLWRFLSEWEKCGQPSWFLVMGIDNGADPEMVRAWYEALFPTDNCLSWRSLLGGLNMWFHYVSLFVRFQTWHDSPVLQRRIFWDSERCGNRGKLVGPGHYRKDGTPRQHHLQQPRYSPVQRSLKLQLCHEGCTWFAWFILICPVSNVEDSLKMFERNMHLCDSVVLPDVIWFTQLICFVILCFRCNERVLSG